MTTETTKHTPGPWGLALGELMGASVTAENGDRIIAEVVYPYETTGWGPEDEANARLLAAAPDLLAALEELKRTIKQLDSYPGTRYVGGVPAGMIEAVHRAAEQADAAIAKARGGS